MTSILHLIKYQKYVSFIICIVKYKYFSRKFFHNLWLFKSFIWLNPTTKTICEITSTIIIETTITVRTITRTTYIQLPYQLQITTPTKNNRNMKTTVKTIKKYPPQCNNIIKTTIILKPKIKFKTTATTRVSNNMMKNHKIS